MRTWFWLLLLGNVILFALIQQGWVWREGPMVQAQPALHQEKVRLLDNTPIAPVFSSRAPVPPAVSHPSPSKPPLLVADSSPVTRGANAEVCLEWGDFSGTELKLATTAISDMNLGDKVDKRQVDQVIRYWVYIPPLKNKAAVQQKIAQLKARGIDEYYVLQDADPWRNAISLGVFKTEEAAQNFLNALRTKDVRTARVGARAGKQKATIFIIKGVSPATEAKINSLKKDFPGSELKNVPCAH
jgi:hypothetical protein